MTNNSNLQSYISKESFFKAVVEDGSDIIFIVDFDGNILYHNSAVNHILGYPSRSLVHENFFDYLDPETLYDFKKKFKGFTKSPYSKNIEFKFRKFDQTYQYLEFNAINLNHKEGIDGFILDCRDIMQLKQNAQELLEAKKAKELFLANMSHEIRTPINGISGMINLLDATKLSSEQQKFLTAIRHSTENLNVILNDILDLSVLESGKLNFEQIGFRINSLLPRIIDNFIPQTNEKGVALNFELIPESEMVLLGDPVRLGQILTNLLSNAVKFTLEGSIEVKVKVRRIKNHFVELAFEITDTGIGIPDEKLSSIFESFRQADDSITRKFGGTGLGLSIVKQLVDLQGGTIEVASKENIGSTFSFTIPYQIGREEDLLEEYQLSETPDASKLLSGMRILLVEDNDINRLYAANIIKGWDCIVDEAENGLICLEKHKKNIYDIILMDIQMPVMDGLETTKSIRNSFKAPKSQTPIIALTANAIKGDHEKYLASGMNGYISKPFKPEELFQALNKHKADTSANEQDLLAKKSKERSTKHSQKHHGLTDLAYLESISNNEDGFIIEMISTFIETTPESIDRMENCLQEGNLEEVGLLAHKLKPSLTFMGIESMIPIIKEIETLGRKQDNPDKMSALLSEFSRIIRKAIDELKSRQK